jgi:hypothetical protein
MDKKERSTPAMTVTHLFFARVTPTDILVRIQLEERDLIKRTSGGVSHAGADDAVRNGQIAASKSGLAVRTVAQPK